jgi:hypothetical protein
LPPGRYIVGINLGGNLETVPATPYQQPGSDAASTIELGAGTRADLGAIRLPAPARMRLIAGTVQWSDGRPLGLVRVRVYGNASTWRTAKVAADGRFSVELFEGRTYVVKAEAADPRGWGDEDGGEPITPIATTAVTIKLDGDRKDLVLVLRPAGSSQIERRR